MECTHMGSLMGKVGSLNARLRLLKCTQSAQFIGLFPPKDPLLLRNGDCKGAKPIPRIGPLTRSSHLR